MKKFDLGEYRVRSEELKATQHRLRKSLPKRRPQTSATPAPRGLPTSDRHIRDRVAIEFLHKKWGDKFAGELNKATIVSSPRTLYDLARGVPTVTENIKVKIGSKEFLKELDGKLLYGQELCWQEREFLSELMQKHLFDGKRGRPSKFIRGGVTLATACVEVSERFGYALPGKIGGRNTQSCIANSPRGGHTAVSIVSEAMRKKGRKVTDEANRKTLEKIYRICPELFQRIREGVKTRPN